MPNAPGPSAAGPSAAGSALLAPALAVLALLVALLPAAPARAVTFVEQIERLREIHALLLDLRPGQAPTPTATAQWELSLELIPYPALDTRVGGKDTPIDAPPLIPRGRLRYLSPAGWMLGATASPPLEVLGHTATWLGLEGGLRGTVGGLHAELRLFTIQGEVVGPITDPATRDTFTFANRGADLRAGLPFGAWSLYAGGGSGEAFSALDVALDGAHDEGRTDYDYWLAGATWCGGPWCFTLEQHRSAGFLSHVILSTSYRW
jgi:hypothetical protein